MDDVLGDAAATISSSKLTLQPLTEARASTPVFLQLSAQ